MKPLCDLGPFTDWDGLDHGLVIRGDLGSQSRRAHTVIGNAVNVLQDCVVSPREEAVASQSIVDQVQSQFSFEAPQTIDLKGILSRFMPIR